MRVFWLMHWLMVVSKYWSWKPPPTYPDSISSHPSPQQPLTAFAACSCGLPRSCVCIQTHSRFTLLFWARHSGFGADGIIQQSAAVSWGARDWDCFLSLTDMMKTSFLSVWRWPCGWVKCLCVMCTSAWVCVYEQGATGVSSSRDNLFKFWYLWMCCCDEAFE